MDRIWSISVPEIVADIMPLMRAASPKAKQALLPVGRIGKLAVVDVAGPMTRYGLTSLWHDTVGTAMVPLADQVRQLTVDATVEAVVFRFDSPGGTVRGTPELADAVADLSKAKPTVGFVDGLAASAAYFVASQVRKVYATKSSDVGSIGTIYVVPDFSVMMAREGIKVHVIATGPLKGTGAFGAEVTPEQIEYLQGMVNESQSMFDLAVQTGRRLSMDQMKAIRPGQVFMAGTARKMGLVDGIASTMGDAVRLAGLGHLLAN